METEEAGSEPKLRTDSSQYRTGLKIALSWCIPTVTMVVVGRDYIAPPDYLRHYTHGLIRVV